MEFIKPETKTRRLNLRIDNECYLQLEELSNHHGISMSEIIRQLIANKYREETEMKY